jgi:elongation factor Tu
MFDSTKPDFEAEIEFLATEDGGRRTPFGTGYRPNHRFGDRVEINDALHTYHREGPVAPGESVAASLSLLSAERVSGELHVGMQFTVQEGGRIVGRGVITRILNPVVQKGAR